MIILGLDPGIARLGWGVIHKTQNTPVPESFGLGTGQAKTRKQHRFGAVAYGTISTEKNLPFPKRLMTIKKELQQLLKKYKPNLVAVEKLYFAKNVKTAMMVGEARGAIMLTLAEANVIITEYTPLQVKQAMTGYGAANKKQIQYMVQTLLSLPSAPKPDDTADALAIALTAAQSYRITHLSRKTRT